MPTYLGKFDEEGYEQTRTGYYDSQDPERSTIHADTVVDITDVLPRVSAQAVLKYARDSRRDFVLLCDRYEEGIDLGMSTKCYPDELETDEGAQMYADIWDIDLAGLIQIVKEHRPQYEQPLAGLN